MADKKQQEMKEQITAFLKKKDYYEILNVPKSADDKQIKDSYRKLALRFHPDKNKVEGAKEVFKKVSHAYSTLLDKQKRQHYDRFGPQENQPIFNRQRQYYGANADFSQQQFIFRQFFGNGMGNGFFYTNMGNYRHQQQYAHPQQRQAGGFNIMHLILFISLFFMIVPKLFESQPYHSLIATSQYYIVQTTRTIKTPFYVREAFFDYVRGNPRKLDDIQHTVDTQYVYKLRNTCQSNLYYKKRLENTAYSYRGQYRNEYLKKAQDVDLSSCKKFNMLRQKYPQYLSRLYY